MQMHSGQHLLSLVMESPDFNLPTLSWAMNDDEAYVEVPGKPTMEVLREVEKRTNQMIRDGILMRVEVSTERPDTLPQDYDAEKGTIRVICLGELERNTCCGTHVCSTAQLGSIVILQTSSIRGTNTRVHFVVGERVVRSLVRSFSDLKSISAKLNCGISEADDKLALVLEQKRESTREEEFWRQEAAKTESQRMNAELQKNGKSFLYSSKGGLNFLNDVTKKLESLGLSILVCGELKEGGTVLVLGPDPEIVKKVSEEIKSTFPHVKGGGKGSKWQGKSSNWEKGDIDKIQSLLDISQ